MSVADLVHPGTGIMASYVRDALAQHPALVEAMRRRRARIFVVDVPHTDNVDSDLSRSIAALDTRDVDIPIYIAELGLYLLSGRYGAKKRPLEISIAHGRLLAVIGIGEGGALLLSPMLEQLPTDEAVRRLARLVESDAVL